MKTRAAAAGKKAEHCGRTPPPPLATIPPRTHTHTLSNTKERERERDSAVTASAAKIRVMTK
jgi:hypothetical protein